MIQSKTLVTEFETKIFDPELIVRESSMKKEKELLEMLKRK